MIVTGLKSDESLKAYVAFQSNELLVLLIFYTENFYIAIYILQVVV